MKIGDIVVWKFNAQSGISGDIGNDEIYSLS